MFMHVHACSEFRDWQCSHLWKEAKQTRANTLREDGMIWHVLTLELTDIKVWSILIHFEHVWSIWKAASFACAAMCCQARNAIMSNQRHCRSIKDGPLYNIVQLLIMYNCFSQCMSIFASFVHFVQQFTGIWHNLTDFCGKTLCSQARSFAESICQDSFVPQGPEASDLSRPSMSEDVRIYQKPLSVWDSSEHICAFDWSLASGQSILPGQHVCPRCKDVQTFRFCALHCSIVVERCRKCMS